MGLNDFLLVQEVFLVFPLTPNDDKNEYREQQGGQKKKNGFEGLQGRWK